MEAPIDVDNRGVFFLNSQITRDDLKDGAAYTLFIGEKHVDDADLGWLSGTSGTLRNTGSPLNQTKFGGGAGMLWMYTYGTDDSEWDWSKQQIDPITGELVEMQPEDYGETADEPGAAPADDAPSDESAVAGAVTDPELVPDAERHAAPQPAGRQSDCTALSRRFFQPSHRWRELRPRRRIGAVHHRGCHRRLDGPAGKPRRRKNRRRQRMVEYVPGAMPTALRGHGNMSQAWPLRAMALAPDRTR